MSVEQKIAELLAENEEVPIVDNDIDEELQERIDEMSDDDLKNFLVSEEFEQLDEMGQGQVQVYSRIRQVVEGPQEWGGYVSPKQLADYEAKSKAWSDAYYAKKNADDKKYNDGIEKAQQIEHPVESESFHPTLTKHGYKTQQTGGKGWVRSYKYDHENGNSINVNVGINGTSIEGPQGYLTHQNMLDKHLELINRGFKMSKTPGRYDSNQTHTYTHPETKENVEVDPNKIRQENDKNKIKAPVSEDISIDVTADMLALTEGENLTEEFKEKAAIIFEAAIVNRVKEELTRINEEYQVKLTEEVDQIKEGLVEQIDGYLDYVVEQWFEQNEIALDQGMKSEILEGFIGGLKSLFEDHYIDVPEEKYDVLAAVQQEVQELHTKLDEQVDINVNLNNKITGLKVKSVADSLAEDLTMTDKSKFFTLIEDLEVDSVESFQKKAQTIKESYFNKKPAKSQVGSFVSDNPILTEELAEPQIAPEMKSYVSVLNTMSKL